MQKHHKVDNVIGDYTDWFTGNPTNPTKIDFHDRLLGIAFGYCFETSPKFSELADVRLIRTLTPVNIFPDARNIYNSDFLDGVRQIVDPNATYDYYFGVGSVPARSAGSINLHPTLVVYAPAMVPAGSSALARGFVLVLAQLDHKVGKPGGPILVQGGVIYGTDE